MQTIAYIYSPRPTPRLQYILHWIFVEQFGMQFSIITNKENWNSKDGILINYSDEEASDESITIKPYGLLFEEKIIKKQSLGVQRWKQSTVLFYNQPGAIVPFDIFSAVFYLLSRYEEYLPHSKDRHGRYEHTQSAASQFSFLHQPVIDEWLLHLGKILKDIFGIQIVEKTFLLQPTYDIDMAWAYLHKGHKRNIGAGFKDLISFKFKTLRERNQVLRGRLNDPFYSFDILDDLHQQYGLHPVYFFLLGQYSEFDKNINPQHPAMEKLIRRIASQYNIGIHPSYLSNSNVHQLQKEIETLAEITDQNITRSRQHYIKLTLPHTYRNLLDACITDDYSMGYASANGFRAGTSHSFFWYDLENEQITNLRVHPFAFMEVTSKVYQRQNTDEAYAEWERLYNAVKKTNGTFISIWHNHTLGTDRLYNGWSDLYKKMLATHFGY